MDQHLADAYRRTKYVVELEEGELAIRVGTRSVELDRLLADAGVEDWAFLTAYNPWSVQASAEANQREQCALEQRAVVAGYIALAGQGVGDDGEWPPEPSLLVLGIPRYQALAWGRDFGQAAIIVGRMGTPAELVLLVEGDRTPALRESSRE